MSGVIEKIDSMIYLRIEPRQVDEKRDQTKAQQVMVKLAKSKTGKAALSSDKEQKLVAESQRGEKARLRAKAQEVEQEKERERGPSVWF